jgi:phosphoglycerate dehydrogenase-like enzyme
VARRTRRDDDVAVHGIHELDELLPQAEIVTLTLPAARRPTDFSTQQRADSQGVLENAHEWMRNLGV